MKRFVITHVGEHGLRRLTFKQQGHDTYESREEAEKALELFRPGVRRVFGAEAIKSLEVREVECWPGHHDPKRYYVD